MLWNFDKIFSNRNHCSMLILFQGNQQIWILTRRLSVWPLFTDHCAQDFFLPKSKCACPPWTFLSTQDRSRKTHVCKHFYLLKPSSAYTSSHGFHFSVIKLLMSAIYTSQENFGCFVMILNWLRTFYRD